MAHKNAFLTFTDDQCVIGGTAYSELPMLINYDNKIIEVVSDWLRHLRVFRGEKKGSVRQYAYHLRSWWSHINRVGIAWDTVDDFIMMNWREELLRSGKQEQTVNGEVSTVFRFYLWAEREGYVQGLIGEPDWERNIRPPLSVDIKIGRRGVRSYSSPILKRTIARPILPTPTNEEITFVHEALVNLHGNNYALAVRDMVILSWMEQTGARRAEILSLKLFQVPEWDVIDVLQASGEKQEIYLTGKGGKSRSIWAGADLLIQTREYIEEERQAIINRFRIHMGSHYKKPKEIFLSSKTGRVLNPDSISQTYAKAFRKAGIKGSGHRVRARFLTNLAVNTFEVELERHGSIPDLTSTLLPVAQIAGHKEILTLAAYLAPSKKRLLKQTVTERAAADEERAIAAERHLIVNLARLKASNLLCELAKTIESGSKKRIIEVLRKLQDKYAQ